MPTSAIVYYSKSGRSRGAAKQLASVMDVTPTEITTPRFRWPIVGWLSAARAGMTGKSVPLDQRLDLSPHDLVVLVGPVWAGAPAAPLNTVVDVLKAGDQDVAAVLTCGDPKEDAAPIEKIEQRLGRPLKAALVLSNAAQTSSDGTARIEAFAALCGSNLSKAS